MRLNGIESLPHSEHSLLETWFTSLFLSVITQPDLDLYLH